MNTRRTTLLVAILLAIGTGWLTLNYISSVQQSSATSTQQRLVLVAAQEIPARTKITAAMLTRAARPASAVDPDALTDPSNAVGSLALITIPSGATITSSKVGPAADLGLGIRLRRGMRAVSIQTDGVKGVAGLLVPGSLVDVIAIPARQGDEAPTASTILRAIPVLAIGTSIDVTSTASAQQNPNGQIVTLEVSPKQADLLAMADLNATLRLSLRSPGEPANSEPAEALHFAAPTQPAATQPSSPAIPGFDIAQLAAAHPVAAAPAPRSAPAASTSGVVVIDGDHVAGSQSSSSSPVQEP